MKKGDLVKLKGWPPISLGFGAPAPLGILIETTADTDEYWWVLLADNSEHPIPQHQMEVINER